MAQIGELATLISARTEPFTRGLKKAATEANVFANNVQSRIGGAMQNVSEAVSRFTIRLAKMGAAMTVGAAVGGITWGAKLAMDYEKAQLAFEVFLRSQEKAKWLMKEIEIFAEKTPFSQSMLIEATQKLLSYGYGLREVRDMWVQIGNVAALTGADMNTLAEILGRVRTQNRADLMDINRIADRAGQFYDALARRLNVTSSEVRELSRQGKISAEVFAGAFRDMTTGGGALAGGIEKLADSVTGKWSTLVDNIGNSFRLAATEMFEKIDIKALEDKIIRTIGIYRSSLIEATKDAVDILLAGIRLTANTFDLLRMGKSEVSIWYHRAMQSFYMMGTGKEDMRRFKQHEAAVYESQAAQYGAEASIYDRQMLEEQRRTNQLLEKGLSRQQSSAGHVETLR
jgi:tape measure domain-containing protein